MERNGMKTWEETLQNGGRAFLGSFIYRGK